MLNSSYHILLFDSQVTNELKTF